MQHIDIRGAARPLVGELAVPGDKSIGHRAVLLAAIGDGRSRITGLSGGEDNRRTVAAFRALGVAIVEEADGALVIDGRGLAGLRPPAPVAAGGAAAPIDCGNSGTTLRLLAGVLVSRPFASTLAGDRYLEARPMARIAAPLERMGGRVRGRSGPSGELLPPLTVGAVDAAHPLVGIDHRSPRASAQVKSAILLAGLAADGPTTVREPVLSRDHTERMLRARGVPLVLSDDGRVARLDPAGWDRRVAALDVAVPGDLSSAAFLLGAAAVVPGSVVTVRGVGVNPTRTGVLDALRAMGVALAIDPLGDVGGEPVADITAWGSPLRAVEIAGALAVRSIDELPLLAAVAAHAAGETVIRDAAELRVKESDRVAATVAALRALGVHAEERADGLVVRGGRVRGGRVESRGDHRIAMAAAVCALAAEGGSRVDDSANVATSYPQFVASLLRLGAELAVGEDDTGGGGSRR